jgi:hypothetical protein
MADNDSSISNLETQNEIELASLWNNTPSRSSVTQEMKTFYALQATHLESKAKILAAEIRQRQDKMRLINEIVAEINNLTDEKNSLDISENVELLEKLEIAKELGVKIKDGQTKFNALERDRLIENLHLTADNWDKENRHQTQKMEIVIKELDRLMMILKDVDRKEDQAKRPMVAGMRGAS